MPRPPEFEGTHYTIHALTLADGSCPAGEFLDSLTAADRRKLDVLFEMLGNHGKISNPEKFKKIEGTDGIFEFKSFQIRLLCFFASNGRVMLAFGVRKKKDKHKREDINRAEEYRRWFRSHGG